ncbi:hypothetical protein RFI_36300 [Reticulomyxa filosa]|uniref:Pentacotripeptide-repeat region of PRORP domain-containing protein n=1 Tax=Reticulomyxa filosa TaxID=46433 RepID=X6LGM1_RETFI|nr:hypothetical protein RFI_36300 [Reticulomyxa filosa]|eukprot:ETO01138.1 hypothetical protein RFI_36300 [Reticulomyxa filosa]
MKTIIKNMFLVTRLYKKPTLTPIFLNSLRLKSQHETRLEEEHKSNEIKKKLQGQKGALTKIKSPQQSQHERSLIKEMTTINEIIQFLRNTHSQDTSIYAAAIKRCSELKQPNAFHNIIQLIYQQNIPLNIMKLFEQWFIHQEFTSNTTPFNPDLIALSTMIQGCSKKGDVKQALYYFNLLVNHYNLKPNVIICNSMLSVCANACDMESAEIIWNTIQNKPDIQIDRILITSMLNVYAKCRESKKLMNLLDYSQRSEHFISIDEITCSTIMSGLLKDNKIDEMFDFYEHQIPKLLLKNNININYNRIIMLKSIGYLKKMETLNRNEIDKLSHYHQQYLNIFYNELYPLAKDKPISVDDKDIDNLINSYVLLHKSNWMNAVKDFERILYQEQNFIHSLDYWRTDIFNKQQILLDFSLISTTTTCFILRYLMTLNRDELRHKFKNGPIKILCGKGQYSKIVKKGVHYESPKKKSIEDELKKWKIIIRLEQDKFNEAVWCLNQDDVLLFFKTVSPGEDCLK